MAAKRKDHAGHILKTGESEDTERRYHYKVMVNGRRYTASAGTLVELRAKEEQLQADIRDGINTSAASETLNTFFEGYMKTKLNIKPSTKVHYYEEWNANIESTIGQMKICDIKTSTLKGFYAGLAAGTQEINGEKKKLSKSTIQLLHNLIFATLQTAVDDDCIRKNPAVKATSGLGGDKKERKALTRKQTENFLKFVKGSAIYNVYYPLFLFALSSGLRGGELLALQRSDINNTESTISVTKQIQYKDIGNGSAEYYITSPKTVNAVRTVPLTRTARKALQMQKENDFILDKVSKRQTVAGYRQYIFVNRNGKPCTSVGIDSSLSRIVKNYNKQYPEEPLPEISLHVLRHTFISRCAESGMNVKVLQKIAGHARISTTLDIYAHLDETAVIEEMNRIGNDIVGITA